MQGTMLYYAVVVVMLSYIQGVQPQADKCTCRNEIETILHRIGQTDGTVENQVYVIATAKSTAQAASTAVTQLKANMEQLALASLEIQRSINQINQKNSINVSQLASELEKFRDITSNQTIIYTGLLTQFQRTLGVLKNQSKETDTRSQINKNKIEAFGTNLTSFKRNIAVLESGVTNITAMVSQVLNELNVIQTSTAINYNNLTILEGKLDLLSTRYGDVASMTLNINLKVSSLVKQMAINLQSIKNIQSKLIFVENHIELQNTTINQHGLQIGRLQMMNMDHEFKLKTLELNMTMQANAIASKSEVVAVLELANEAKNILIRTMNERIAELEKTVAGLVTSLSIVQSKVVEFHSFTDCDHVYKWGQIKPGTYELKPDGSQPFQAYCDQGWTIIQRRHTNSSGTFDHKWLEYKNGFGSTLGNHWLGNDNIHHLTQQKKYKLQIELRHSSTNYTVTYENFSIEDESANYTLNVSGYTGPLADNFGKYHSGWPFSTSDRDNDGRQGNCAKGYEGGWWYSTCYSVDLNGKDFDWYSEGKFVSMVYSRMMLKPV